MDDPGVMEVTARVLIATIIALVVVLILLFLFHIYARWLWQRRQQAGFNSRPNSREQHHPGVTVLRRGLDAAFLKTIPVFIFDSSSSSKKDHHDVEVECSVCLCELEQGEKTRILPKCNHVFHAECIDMWFHSHSTCPVCRNLVSGEETQEISVESLLLENNHDDEETHEGHEESSGDFPTNVLFWGDETEVSTLTSQLVDNDQLATFLPFEPAAASATASSSSSSQTIDKNDDRLKPDLVIDIPGQQQQQEEELEDDKHSTPIMRSLRRILSSGRRFNPFSPGAEQAQT
ncbi:hypothetical protein SSX86_023895 [Deinandra increscens subsp. villosa]|uniref:RING-type E3 ubiquitin transferase n=1 Tax=Deinandra increscens subsp. villosa TaxID=3103831 RepID=A0AAP0GN87_9ASTR